MVSVTLDTGAVRALSHDLQGRTVVVQVLDVKALGGSGGESRYRLLLSDGSETCQVILGTQFSAMCNSNQIQKNSIIRVIEVSVNMIGDRPIIILLNLEVVQSNYDSVIGNPTVSTAATPSASAQTQGPAQASVSAHTPMHMSSDDGINPISSLNPYQSNWTIMARVTQRGEIRTFNNKRGPGQLFSVDLLDKDGGEIRATMFGEAVDKFYPMMEVNTVLRIRGGTLKPANRKYTTLNNEYELTLHNDSQVTLVNEQEARRIPKMQFNIVPIASLVQAPPGGVVDVAGYVISVGEVSSIQTKKGNMLSKRALTIVDDSRASIELTLWGVRAEQFQGVGVLACKGVRVSDFNGRSLSATMQSLIELNPDVPEVYRIRGWYDSEGNGITPTNLSGGGSFQGKDRTTEIVTVSEFESKNLGRGGEPAYVSVRVTVTQIPTDRTIWYNACPSDGCSKKVSEVSGSWRCEKCNKQFPTCDQRYILSFQGMDHTGTAWFSGFNDVGELVLGHKASELQSLKERGDEPQYQSILKEALFKTFWFRTRAKEEEFEGKFRVKYSIMEAQPLNYAQESAKLADIIRGYGVVC